MRYLMSVDAAVAVLTDPRVDGLSAICDFFKESPQVAFPIYRKAFELLEKFSARALKAETLEIFPKLLALMNDKNLDPALTARARTAFLRLLAIKEGNPSMEETIALLAPLLKEPDAELVRALEAFLVAHTGQNLGRDPEAWKKLLEKMRTQQRGRKENEHLATPAPINLEGPPK
jgi:hypothetical protein